MYSDPDRLTPERVARDMKAFALSVMTCNWITGVWSLDLVPLKPHPSFC